MFIKIVPFTNRIPCSVIYEGEDVRFELFVVCEVDSGVDGLGDYTQLLRESNDNKYFNDNHNKWDWYETVLIWFKDKSGVARVIEAPISSVYIMNDSGKTVDKVTASFSTYPSSLSIEAA